MNKVVLVGNIAKDPELSKTSSGIKVCRFTIAVQRRFANAEGQREADFIPVIAWRGLADNCHKYLRKGSKAGVVGSIQTRSYDANDGTKRYVTEIIADEVEFLSTRNNDDNGGYYDNSDSKPAKKSIDELEEVEDDDSPF